MAVVRTTAQTSSFDKETNVGDRASAGIVEHNQSVPALHQVEHAIYLLYPVICIDLLPEPRIPFSRYRMTQ